MHDAARHVEGLRLSLAQDKAPIGFLLAAGCPRAIEVDEKPLIPDIAGMTQALTASIERSKAASPFEKLLKCFADDGKPNSNVEDWLSQIRALRFVAGGGSVRELSAPELDALEQAVTQGIVELAEKDLPGDSTPYHNLAAWAGAIERTTPVEIFTTNYDLLTEQAFEALRGAYFDGFVGAHQPFFDNASVSAADNPPLPPRFTRLWKLHGSVNWYLTANGQVVRSQAGSGLRRLIYPSHLKYDESRQMPYLALLDRLRAFLSQRSARLLTCGYSFGDQHINAVLRDALQANPTASIVALGFSTIDKYTESKQLALSRPNFALFARDAAIIGTREDIWGVRQGITEQLPGVEIDGATVQVRLGDFRELGTLLAGLLDRLPARP